MSKITTIYPAIPNEETIYYLRDLLSKAESGQLQTIAATGLLVEGAVISCISNPKQPFLLLGALENLKSNVNKFIE